MPEKTKLRLLKSVLLPGVELLFNCMVIYKSIRQAQLARMQEKGLLALFNDNTSSYEILLKKAAPQTSYNGRLQDLAILMFKVKNGMSPDYVSELSQRSDTDYNLRNSDLVYDH